MRKFTVHTRQYNDRSNPDSLFGHSYGGKIFSPGVMARDASDAISRFSTSGKTGVLAVSGITLDLDPDVQAATLRSCEVVNEAQMKRGN